MASSKLPFQSLMGNLSVDGALEKLGMSRRQLDDHAAAMRQFLSSDATFLPANTRSFTQHASQPSLPAFPSTSTSTSAALARSRSLDSPAMSAMAGAYPGPAQTPSRTRKADSMDGTDVQERDSKRRRGEKVPSRQPSSQPSAPPPRKPDFPSTSSSSSAQVHQDVFWDDADDDDDDDVQLVSIADIRAHAPPPPPPVRPLKPSHPRVASGLPGAPPLPFGPGYALPPGYQWVHYDPKLPFRLPAGPYSHEKPNLPYAALIGQAILASHFGRLPLNDIYTYITIVHPFYKRAPDAVWMNSIRHLLSTNDSFDKIAHHPNDMITRGPCWTIRADHLAFFAGGGYSKPRSPLKSSSVSPVKAEPAKPRTQQHVQVKEEEPAAWAIPAAKSVYYREPAAPAPSAPAPASYYNATTWRYPALPPLHAATFAAPRAAPPVIASSSPARTPADAARRFQAFLDEESEGEESPLTPPPLSPARALGHARSGSLMERMLDKSAAGSPTTPLMERTLAAHVAVKVEEVDDEGEVELTPSPVSVVLQLPPVELHAEVEYEQEREQVVEEEQPVEMHEEGEPLPQPEELDPELDFILDPELDAEHAAEPVPEVEVEAYAEEDELADDSGYHSSHSSPGVPLALLIAKRKIELQKKKQLQQQQPTFNLPIVPQSPVSSLRSTARVVKKGGKKGKKGKSAKSKKKKAPVEPEPEPEAVEEEDMPATGEEELESEILAGPERFSTPPPQHSGAAASSQLHPMSPFRTPLTSRNSGDGVARGGKYDVSASPMRPFMFATPKRGGVGSGSGFGVLGSPQKTPLAAEDPFNATAMLEQQLAELGQGSPVRDRTAGLWAEASPMWASLQHQWSNADYF